MRTFAAAVLGGAVVVVAFLLLNGEPGMAQQPQSYVDISQADFEAIDGVVRKFFAPLKKGDTAAFKKLFIELSVPNMPGVDALENVVVKYANTFGRHRDLKYVRHYAIKNVTDYYVFFYADMREISVMPWELTFYKVKDKWTITGFRTEAGCPVDFFKFPELQYKSFKR